MSILGVVMFIHNLETRNMGDSISTESGSKGCASAQSTAAMFLTIMTGWL